VTRAQLYALEHGVTLETAEAELARQREEGLAFLREVMGDDFDKVVL
jgi:hypothetical protein